MIQSFKDLDVWNKAIEVTKDIYKATKSFPKEEIYGLASQIRRSAISIPSNIAEGKARQTKSEYIQYLYIALGSTAELQTQVIIANELDYIDNKATKEHLESINHIERMLRNLIKGLRSSQDFSHRKPLTVNR